MSQVHVITGRERRRRWSDEEKRTIVAAAFAPGAVVADVARRADVCSSLIYRWRREIGPPVGFAEVVVDPCGVERRSHSALPSVETVRSDASEVPAIDVELFGSSRVCIPASIPPELAAAVIKALVRR